MIILLFYWFSPIEHDLFYSGLDYLTKKKIENYEIIPLDIDLLRNPNYPRDFCRRAAEFLFFLLPEIQN